MNTDFNLFKNKRVLLTGDTGFKGSWLSIWLLELGAEVYGYSLPAATDEDNFVKCGLRNRIHHCDGDVRDLAKLKNYFNDIQPDIAIHMAAQSLVLTSYNDPVLNYETNLMGTVNFFEAVRSTKSVKAAINVTSDKCYDNKEIIWGYREIDAMGGKDPYSASKGCSELITNSYIASFFTNNDTNIASVRAGNVIGAGDWSENRIIPDLFRAIQRNSSLSIRNPYSTRPWQFVLEPLRGYLTLIVHLYNDYGKSKAFQGGWNFGPTDHNNVNVETLIKSIIKANNNEGQFSVLDASKTEQGKEATLLKLDISKAKQLLNWEPALNFAQTVSFTTEGYQVDLEKANNSEKTYQARVQQIKKYTSLFTVS